MPDPTDSPASKIKNNNQVAAPTPVLTPDFRVSEQAYFDRKLASDDDAREKAGPATMVAIAAFTLMVDDPKLPDGKLIKAGDEFEISAFDVPRFSGRARLKSLDDPNRAGVTSNRE